jgi:hypothetical protein
MTSTHTHTYIYIYIARDGGMEGEREIGSVQNTHAHSKSNPNLFLLSHGKSHDNKPREQRQYEIHDPRICYMLISAPPRIAIRSGCEILPPENI